MSGDGHWILCFHELGDEDGCLALVVVDEGGALVDVDEGDRILDTPVAKTLAEFSQTRSSCHRPQHADVDEYVLQDVA